MTFYERLLNWKGKNISLYAPSLNQSGYTQGELVELDEESAVLICRDSNNPDNPWKNQETIVRLSTIVAARLFDQDRGLEAFR